MVGFARAPKGAKVGVQYLGRQREHRIGDETVALEPGMAICIPRGVPHW
jgi:hypothetical protein